MHPLVSHYTSNGHFKRQMPTPTSDDIVETSIYTSPPNHLDDFDHFDDFDYSGSDDEERINRVSAALSPRTLYAQYSDSPSSRSFRGTGPGGRFRKNITMLTGIKASTTEEEFDALPIAVRKKYISTLERLRFAQSSRSKSISELPTQVEGHWPLKSHRPFPPRSHSRHGNSLADRRGINIGLLDPQCKTTGRNHHITRNHPAPSNSPLCLIAKIENNLTRDEQVLLASRLRRSVLLEAAEAILDQTERPANSDSTSSEPQTPSSVSSVSMAEEPQSTNDEALRLAADFHENFRWIDDQDLDLKLSLGSSPVNSESEALNTPARRRKPSFRRQISITKVPFGRNSMPSPRSPPIESSSHTRPKSRTMSLVSRHMAKDSVTSIDHNAAHYQDPDARKKLRTCLATTQKFDEAIQFGFPSTDGMAENVVHTESRLPMVLPEITSLAKKRLPKNQSFSTERSFLADDAISLFEDDVSVAEPESPITPEATCRPPRMVMPVASKNVKNSQDFSHLGIVRPIIVKQTESPPVVAGREMTLRMTLTRPDLRADESKIYGWQNSQGSRELPVSTAFESDEKYAVKGPFGGSDGWGPPDEKENGVVKRLWNKVKSTQKS